MIALTAQSGIGVIGILILGAIALFMTYVQVALMVVRGGLLVILAGVLPLTASFTNTQMSKQWFGKVIGWTIAFILDKPAAALCVPPRCCAREHGAPWRARPCSICCLQSTSRHGIMPVTNEKLSIWNALDVPHIALPRQREAPSGGRR